MVKYSKTFELANQCFRQGKNTKTFHRWVVKVDANTGATIWEFSMPSTDARAGKHSGYESVVFTEDGGFIAGGFAQGWAPKNSPTAFLTI